MEWGDSPQSLRNPEQKSISRKLRGNFWSSLGVSRGKRSCSFFTSNGVSTSTEWLKPAIAVGIAASTKYTKFTCSVKFLLKPSTASSLAHWADKLSWIQIAPTCLEKSLAARAKVPERHFAVGSGASPWPRLPERVHQCAL